MITHCSISFVVVGVIYPPFLIFANFSIAACASRMFLSFGWKYTSFPKRLLLTRFADRIFERRFDTSDCGLFTAAIICWPFFPSLAAVRIFWLMGDFNIPTNLAASLIVLSFILKNFGEKIKHKYKDNFQI